MKVSSIDAVNLAPCFRTGPSPERVFSGRMRSLTLRHFHDVPGRLYRTPKELWGFRLPAVAGNPRDVARRALVANAGRLGLDRILGSLHARRIIRSRAAWHVIFS